MSGNSSCNSGYAGGNTLSSMMSDSEREFVLSGCRVGCRLDGRTRKSFRPYIIEQSSGDDSLLPLCHGYARLQGSVGHASNETQHLLCSVRAELARPCISRPNQGIVNLYLTTTTSSSSSFIYNKRDLDHWQETLNQLTAQHLVDTRQLCIQPKEFVWKLNVDVLILEGAGGSLLDGACQVIVAALQSTKLPHVTTTTTTTTTQQEQQQQLPDDLIHDERQSNNINSKTVLVVDSDAKKAHGIALQHCDNEDSDSTCCILTVAVLLDYDWANTKKTRRPVYVCLVDATLQEEQCAIALVHLCLAGNPSRIVAFSTKTQQSGGSGGGGGALPWMVLPEITQLALESLPAARRAYKKVATAPTTLHSPTQSQPHSSRLLQPQFQWQ